MLNKIKIAIAALAGLFFLAMPAAALADNNVSGPITGGVCSGANSLTISDNDQNTCNVGNQTTGTFNNILKKIINIFSVIVGVVAVIMIVYGGFRYITSGGNSEKITSARNTIVYALIGLVIVALAQIIVKFVLNKATSA